MNHRRKFLKWAAGSFAAAVTLLNPMVGWLHKAIAETAKKLLPADFPKTQLIHEDPDKVDARNIAITPLSDFKTMGLTDYEEDMASWRLEVAGRVQRPLQLTLAEIRQLPVVEKKELMICPGFFANQGLWRGISIADLLNRAGMPSGAEKVIIHGANGEATKTETFPLTDIIAGEVFLAYEINGAPLPRKHGYPLRIVAGGYYGDDWVKYVFKVEVI